MDQRDFVRQKEEDDILIIDFRELGYALKKYFIWIVLVTFFMTGLAGAITYLVRTPKYESDAMLYFRTEGSTTNETLQGLQIGSQVLKDYQIILHSEPLAQMVIDELGLNVSAAQLLKQVKVEEFDQTHILQLAIIDENPYQAKKIATSFANNAVLLVDKIEKTPPYLIEKPKLNLSPVSPNHKKDIAFGALIGLFISLGFVFLKTILSDKLKKADDIERILSVPVIGMISKDESLQYMQKSSRRKRRVRK